MANPIVAAPVVTVPLLSGVRQIHAAVTKRFALFAGVVTDRAATSIGKELFNLMLE